MRKLYYVAVHVWYGFSGDWYFVAGEFTNKKEAEAVKRNFQKLETDKRRLYYVEWVHADLNGLTQLAKIKEKYLATAKEGGYN